jgi:CRISPR-associated protein, Crm2 family
MIAAMRKKYLIEISFGPVQSFIASARRSRDLWAGSHLLSEVARAAGHALIREGAELIYPLSGRVEQANREENSNLSNVVLARVSVSDQDEVERIVTRVQDTARDRLKAMAKEAWNEWVTEGKVKLRTDFWDRQVEDALESYGAWAQIPEQGAEGKTAYRMAYDRLKKTFAARKNTRNFEPMFEMSKARLGEGIPKSSFDGLRESVLPKDRKHFPPRFGMSANEQLDALGCIKRTVGRKECFVALPRLAAHDWLKSLTENDRQSLANVYEKLVGANLATRTKTVQGQFDAFPYDAGLLYPERLEQEKKQNEDADILSKLGDLSNVLKPLWKKYGQPCSYAVMVVADGDRMGKFVDRATEADQHTRVSAAVAKFADEVPNIAARHGGVSVFNGGEDLMVLFPLSGIMAGARDLAQRFDEFMKDIVEELCTGSTEARPTLRVGAAICHVLEPLGLIRRWGDEAEKVAKGDVGGDAQGNALGLVLHIRAGHEIGLRIPFSDEVGFDALKRWIAAYRDRKQPGESGSLPGRMGYDIRAIGLDCTRHGYGADVAHGEFVRLLSRARQSGGVDKISSDMAQALNRRLDDLGGRIASDEVNRSTDSTITAMLSLADELILARWLAAIRASDINFRHGGA